MSWLVFNGSVAAFVLLVLAWPELALSLGALALLWDLPLNLGPLTVFSSEAVLLGLALGAAIQLRWSGLKDRTPPFLAYAGGAWLLWFGLHAIDPGPVWGSAKAALRAGELLLGLALPLWLGAGRRSLTALLGVAGIAAAWASLQSLAGPTSVLNAGREIELINGFQAGAASLGHHNQLGAYMAAALPMALALAWVDARLRRGALAAAALLGAGLLSSFSRGAWLGLGVGALVAACALSWRWGLGVLAGLALLGAVALWGPSAAMHDRMVNIAGNTDRQFLVQQAVSLWDGHYVWGLGAGSIEREWPRRVAVAARPDATRSFGAHLHNTYLQWAVEFGALAALLPLAILFWLMARGWAAPGDPWALALLAMSLAFTLQAGTDVLTLHARGACVSLCWGLALALARPLRGN